MTAPAAPIPPEEGFLRAIRENPDDDAPRLIYYDCLYVALAEQEGCPFLTADDRLVRVLQSQFPFILPLASATLTAVRLLVLAQSSPDRHHQ